MINKLKTIYKDRLIEKVTSFNYDKYYYFYLPGTPEVFGIDKGITTNEYELIKTTYIEKKVYSNTLGYQQIYEYVLEDKPYPFQNKRAKIIIVEDSAEDIEQIMCEFYKLVYPIKLDNIQAFFCLDSLGGSLNDLISVITFELGKSIKIHDGIYVNNTFEGHTILNYLSLIKQFFKYTSDEYSDISTPLLKYNEDVTYKYSKLIDEYVIKKVLSDSTTKDIILTYFKNDLNVSQTSKILYINRNSLLNKFENIYKETGFNLQKFNHACALYIFIQNKG